MDLGGRRLGYQIPGMVAIALGTPIVFGLSEVTTGIAVGLLVGYLAALVFGSRMSE
jgi:hypothetical protein